MSPLSPITPLGNLDLAKLVEIKKKIWLLDLNGKKYIVCLIIFQALLLFSHF